MHPEEVIAEVRRRQKHPHNQYIPGDIDGWDQLSFHRSPARYRMVFGGNQSGKSYTAAYEISCWLRGQHPHRAIPSGPIQVWSISAEYSTLEEGVYRHLVGSGEENLLPSWEIKTFGPKIPQTNMASFILLKNGSLIRFKSAKGDSRTKFQAAAVDLISIDEEIDRSGWDELQMRTLKTGGNFIISATLVESYDWIVDLEKRAEEGEHGYFLTRLHTEKNPYLDKETVQRMRNVLSEEELEIRYLGRSRRTTGLVYKDFQDSNIVDDFTIPYDWPRWQALDPGIRTFAGLWLTISPPQAGKCKVYIYREMYEHNMPLYEVAMVIKTSEGYKLDRELSEKFEHFVWEERDEGMSADIPSEHLIERFIDDKRHSRLITGEEGVLEQLYTRYGISTTPANKDKRPGIEDVRYWLTNGLHVFRSCENFIREIRRYRIRPLANKRNANDTIDEPVKSHDHLMDCIRYLAIEGLTFKDGTAHLPRPVQQKYMTGQEVLSSILKKQRSTEVHNVLGAIS